MLANRFRDACETVWELQLLHMRWGLPHVLVRTLLRPLEWAFVAMFGRRTVAGWWARWVLMVLLEMLNRSRRAAPLR